MFGKKKAERIRELEAECLRQREYIMKLQQESTKVVPQLRNAQNQVEYLVRTIRQMDDQIFQMSQMGTFEGMRPYLRTLVDAMTARKVAESDRISDIVCSQLLETYKPKTKPEHDSQNDAIRALKNWNG